MRKLISAAAVCALAIGLVVVSGAGAVKSTKEVGGTVSINVTPNPVPVATSTVTASGNVAANSNCRKNRTVNVAYSSNPGTVVGSAVTKNNGDYQIPNIPKPTTSGDTLQVTVTDGGLRRVGGKKKSTREKKGRKFHCNALPFPATNPPTTSAPIVLGT